MKKKLVAILTLCVILCTAICGLISCSSDNGTEGLNYMLNEDNASYCVRGIGTAEDNKIVIPDKYKGKPVTKISDSAFHNTPIVSVIIGNSVTTIGNSAFSSCVSLTNVRIPDSVTTIGEFVFCECSSLTSITIPDSVTTIGEFVFCECSSLTSITIPNSVTSIGDYAFQLCSSLQTIYCEAESQPSGWYSDWKYGCGAQVVWGYKGE